MAKPMYNHYSKPIQNRLENLAISRKFNVVVDNSPTSASPAYAVYATNVLTNNEDRMGYLSTSVMCNVSPTDVTTCFQPIQLLACGQFEPIPKRESAGELGELIVKRNLDIIL